MGASDFFWLGIAIFAYIAGRRSSSTSTVEHRKIKIEMDSKDAGRQLAAMEERVNRLSKSIDDFNAKVAPRK